MPKISNKLNKFKQWTKETIGKGEKTDKGDEFNELKADAEFRAKNTELIYEKLNEYVKTLGVKKSKNTMTEFGAALTSYGDGLGSDSNYGQALNATGSAYVDVSGSLNLVITAMNTCYGSGLYRFLQEAAQVEKLQKKTEARRLDYDAKAAKLGAKKKNEASLIDEDTRVAKSKFEESLQECTLKMKALQMSEHEQLVGLIQVVEAQEAYFEMAAKAFSALRRNLESKKVATAAKTSQLDVPDSEKLSSMTLSDESKAPFDSANPSMIALVPENQSRFSFQTLRSRSQSHSSTSTVASSVLDEEVSRLGTTKAYRNDQELGRLVTTKACHKDQERVTVLYDFYPEGNDDVRLVKGETVIVIEKVSDGWWRGQVENDVSRTGLFPTNYVAPIPKPTVVPKQQPLHPHVPSVAKPISFKSRGYSFDGIRISPPITQSNFEQTLASQQPPCSTCECTMFKPNMFREGYCNECCHKHKPQC